MLRTGAATLNGRGVALALAPGRCQQAVRVTLTLRLRRGRGPRARARLLQYEGVDDVRLAPDAVAQLARHVRDRPPDYYHHQRHHVLGTNRMTITFSQEKYMK